MKDQIDTIKQQCTTATIHTETCSCQTDMRSITKHTAATSNTRGRQGSSSRKHNKHCIVHVDDVCDAIEYRTHKQNNEQGITITQQHTPTAPHSLFTLKNKAHRCMTLYKWQRKHQKQYSTTSMIGFIQWQALLPCFIPLSLAPITNSLMAACTLFFFLP